MDSLRHWTESMRVDGFRFDLASIFTRDSSGEVDLHDPPLIAEISAFSERADRRVVAEAWDVASYQLGRAFPGVTWLQWNGKFRTTSAAPCGATRARAGPDAPLRQRRPLSG